MSKPLGEVRWSDQGAVPQVIELDEDGTWVWPESSRLEGAEYQALEITRMMLNTFFSPKNTVMEGPPSPIDYPRGIGELLAAAKWLDGKAVFSQPILQRDGP